MISKRDLKEHELTNIEEYFEYIVNSQVNGQFTQVQNLINELSSNQKKDALDYISNLYAPDNTPDYVNKVQSKILESI